MNVGQRGRAEGATARRKLRTIRNVGVIVYCQVTMRWPESRKVSKRHRTGREGCVGSPSWKLGV
jgi:hypothetical protein